MGASSLPGWLRRLPERLAQNLQAVSHLAPAACNWAVAAGAQLDESGHHGLSLEGNKKRLTVFYLAVRIMEWKG